MGNASTMLSLSYNSGSLGYHLFFYFPKNPRPSKENEYKPKDNSKQPAEHISAWERRLVSWNELYYKSN